MRGFDTETEHGRAVLLAIAPARGAESVLDVARLAPSKAIREILAFLIRADCECVGWNADFDARAVLAYAPRRWLWRLVRFGMGVWPGTKYRVRYIPGKVFEIRGSGRRFALYDAQQFYGGSLAARAPLVGMVKGDPGVSWRAIGSTLRRGGARATRIRDYCVQDARIVAALWNYVERALKKLAVNCARPYSPAALAARFFIPKPRPIAAYAQDWGERAYYGGRSEIFQRGRFRDVRYYDIHSAYPWALSEMVAWDCVEPCKSLDRACYAIVEADLNVPANVPFGPVPVRNRGVLVYPTGIIPAYVMDLHTFRAVERAGFIRKVRRVYAWQPDPFARPQIAFPAIPELYRLKEKSPDLRLAAKLMLNGLSGKLAELRETWFEDDWVQSDDTLPDGTGISRRWKLAARTNFVQAAHCTGRVRAHLWECMMRDAGAIIGCATDGIFATRDIPVKLGPNLGEWGVEIVPDHVQIASGMYLHGDLQTLRGFATKDNILAKLRGAGQRSVITVRCGLPTTLLHSLRTGDQVNLIGTWTRKLDLNCDIKRTWPAPITARDLLLTRHAQSSVPLKTEELCPARNRKDQPSPTPPKRRNRRRKKRAKEPLL